MQSDIGWSIDFDYAGIDRVGDEEFTLRAAGFEEVSRQNVLIWSSSMTLSNPVQTSKTRQFGMR